MTQYHDTAPHCRDCAAAPTCDLRSKLSIALRPPGRHLHAFLSTPDSKAILNRTFADLAAHCKRFRPKKSP